MHLITETLLVGNINDAKEPPVKIGALLLVAAEYTLESPSWLLSGMIPFSEYAEAEPLLLDQAVNWVEQHISDQSGHGLLPRRHGPIRVGCDGLSLLCPRDDVC